MGDRPHAGRRLRAAGRAGHRFLGGGRAYVGEPRVFLASWFPEPAGLMGSREKRLLIDSVGVLLPEPAHLSETVVRQLQYGALQSALETETALRMAAAWDPTDRIVFSTSLAMNTALTMLTPSDVTRLPAASAEALKSALRGGDLAIVPGQVSTATAWWTVARSGSIRAVVNPGAGASTIGPRVPGPRPPTIKPPSQPKPPPIKPPEKKITLRRSLGCTRDRRGRSLGSIPTKMSSRPGDRIRATIPNVLGVSAAVEEGVSSFGTDAVRRVFARLADVLSEP